MRGKPAHQGAPDAAENVVDSWLCGEVTQLDNGGAVLGVFPNWKYEDSVVPLAPGDRLVLFTDGITEAARPDGELFGEEGLVRLIKTLADEPPSKLNEKLLTDVRHFCDSHLQDDATLIAVTVHPTRAGGNLGNNSTALLAFSPEGKGSSLFCASRWE